MKSIEQIAIRVANTITAPYITDESLTRFATKFLEAWLAQQEPSSFDILTALKDGDSYSAQAKSA